MTINLSVLCDYHSGFSVSMKKLTVFHFLTAPSAPSYIRQANELSGKEKKILLVTKEKYALPATWSRA